MANTHTNLSSLFTNIASGIRSITGETGTIVADNFPTKLGEIKNEVDEQAVLIEELKAALEDKTGAGSGGADSCAVAFTGAAHQNIAYTTVDASGNMVSGLSGTGTAAATKNLVCMCNSMLTVLYLATNTRTVVCENCRLLAKNNYAAAFWITAGAGETATITFTAGGASGGLTS